MNRIRTYLIAFVVAITSTVHAQNLDHEVWTGPTVRYNINNDVRTYLEYQTRFNLTAGTLRNNFVETGIRYKVEKYFLVQAYFRYTDFPSATKRSRVALQLYGKLTAKDFPIELSYRMQFERNFTMQDETGNRPVETYWRNQVAIDVNVSRLVDPFIAYEYFHQLDGVNYAAKGRFTLGLDWRISKNLDATTYWRLQDDWQADNLRKSVYGIYLTYNLKFEKKEEKLTE